MLTREMLFETFTGGWRLAVPQTQVLDESAGGPQRKDFLTLHDPLAVRPRPIPSFSPMRGCGRCSRTPSAQQPSQLRAGRAGGAFGLVLLARGAVAS
jgi:hypothetical protein